MQIYIFLVLVLSVLVAVFAVQNSSLVDLRFLGWTMHQVSLVMVIVFSFSIGALASFLISLQRQIKLAIKLRESASLNKQLTEELERLKVSTKEKDNNL